MEEYNKRFDVHEFTYWEFKEGLKPIGGDIEKLGSERTCILGHKVHIALVGMDNERKLSGTDNIKKIMYIREFDCKECKKVIYGISEIWNNWIPYGASFEVNGKDSLVRHSISFELS